MACMTGVRARPGTRLAGGKDAVIGGGGADVVNQYLRAGLVDELELHIVPLALGGGARIFDGPGPELELEQLRAIEARGVTSSTACSSRSVPRGASSSRPG